MNFATQRPRDPMFYWRQNNLPYDIAKESELIKVRNYCRLLYMTHPIVASCIDIYSKYPLVGMELKCKDPEIKEFYETLLFDDLNYEEYLVDINREYWLVGEAWPMGSFNDDLGVWEGDELINPDDVFVQVSPFLKRGPLGEGKNLTIRLPQSLRNIIQTGQPREQYVALMRSYPELRHFASENSRMPVSNILLKQLMFKGDTFHQRGVPILMRGFRAIWQEEMLNAAQDAIADRLYTPLILAKLGASASDLGTPQPWIPTPGQIQDFEEALDAALAADFRVLTHHFAVDMSSVFGRETMPNFDADFDRLIERELAVFGLSKTMLLGAGSGETYAADALNRDLVSQLLTHNQRGLKRFIRDRMLVVAEAQRHYDYEIRGKDKYPVMEEVLVVDEETGEKRIIEQPKLLVPDITMRTMNIRSEEGERQFIEALRMQGVPISMRSRLTNIPIDFDDEVEAASEEQVQLAVSAQETRKKQYQALKAANLPIEEGLKKDFEPKAIGSKEGDEASAEQARVPQAGVDDPQHSALAPTVDDLMQPPGEAGEAGGEPPGAKIITLPRGPMTTLPGARPPESDEMRASMPKPASIKVSKVVGETDEDDPQPIFAEEEVTGRLIAGPKHVGLRRVMAEKGLVDKDKPLDGPAVEETA